LKHAHRQVVAANGAYPQDDQDEGQHEAEIQEHLQQLITAAVLQRIPVHLGHPQAGKGKQRAEQAASHRQKELDHDLGGGTTAKIK